MCRTILYEISSKQDEKNINLVVTQKYKQCRTDTPGDKRRGELQSMSDKIIENNQVTVIGSVASEFTYSHEVFGEGFYMVDILVKRLSNSSDRIPVMVSERLIDVTQDYKGRSIMVSGQFRSYNRHEEQKNRLVLSVFAREMEFIEEEPDGAKTNHILLEGYMCKTPVYRKTPLGREIADLLLAVNRPYGKSDYIPCICWGRNARYADPPSAGVGRAGGPAGWRCKQRSLCSKVFIPSSVSANQHCSVFRHRLSVRCLPSALSSEIPLRHPAQEL